MRELSLFSGAGGGLLGTLLLGWRPIGYVENNEYCQQVIAQRIADGILPIAPIFGDVRTFTSEGYAASYSGMVDVITAGFPCQPFSVAGKQQAADDDRNMWPATNEIIRQVRPAFVLLENVPGLLSTGYAFVVIGDLQRLGYQVLPPTIVGADDVGAPHRRERLWICAYAAGDRTRGIPVRQGQPRQAATDANGMGEDVPDAACQQDWWVQQRAFSSDAGTGGEVRDPTSAGLSDGGSSQVGKSEAQPQSQRSNCQIPHADCQGQPQSRAVGGESEIARPEPCGDWGQWWATEPQLGRLAHGIPHRVDRLRAAGNGQVPAVVAAAWHLLTEGIAD